MLYLIPPFVDAKPSVMQLILRAGVSYVDASKLHELWAFASSGAISIASIPASQLAILARHSDTLLPELPTCVTGIPGAFYSSEWNILAASLPAVPWLQVEGQIAKSGLLANNVDQLAKRSAETVAPPALASKSRLAPRGSVQARPPAEEEEEEFVEADDDV